jgi:hypothetical protein
MRPLKSKLVVASVAVVTTLFTEGVVFGEQAVSYGRAGGTVGADRIQQVAAVKAGQNAQPSNLSKWYGRAGGTTGSDRVQQLAALKSEPEKIYGAGMIRAPEVKVYGRAGVPLPFDH